MKIDKPDPVYNALLTYVVALYGIRRERSGDFRVVHSGTGTLINYNGILGILTAGHVVKALEPFEIWGYTSFHSPTDFAPMRSFPNAAAQSIRLGDDYDATDGPDIGFIRLPENISSAHPNDTTFLNLGKRFEDLQSRIASPGRPLEVCAIAGVIGEASHMEILPDSTDVYTRMLIAEAKITHKEVRGGFDYYTVRVGETRNGPPPSSYEGLSGGPLFATTHNASAIERHVIGVAFRQSDADEHGRRTILCHGMQSIYRKICKEIKPLAPGDGGDEGGVAWNG